MVPDARNQRRYSLGYSFRAFDPRASCPDEEKALAGGYGFELASVPQPFENSLHTLQLRGLRTPLADSAMPATPPTSIPISSPNTKRMLHLFVAVSPGLAGMILMLQREVNKPWSATVVVKGTHYPSPSGRGSWRW